MKPKIISFYAGPGTGKSTTATAVFTELKQLGVNCEYIPEYAKDATWELRGPKVFDAQEYIFGKQHFRIARVAAEVDIIITDAPLLLGLIYIPEGFQLPSLSDTIREAYELYDNLDVFLERNKPYNPAGRHQTLEEAQALDVRIKRMLEETSKSFFSMPYGPKAIAQTIRNAGKRWGDIPALQDFMPSFQPVLTSKTLPTPFEKVLLEPPQGTSFQVGHIDGKGQWVGEVWGTNMQQYLGYTPRWWLEFIDTADVMGQ